MKRVAECHPNRPYFAKGLCSACYGRKYRKTWKPKTHATCHPDRALKCRGLCSACYQRFKASPDWKQKGRPARVNTCGHPDKPHVSHGMCGACATRARRDRNRQADKTKRRDYQLRKTYGISLDEFNAMYKAQGNRCALCRKEIPVERHRHVDHCHDTGRIRGILCFDCNKGLGMLGDTQKAIARALNYVTVDRTAAQAGVFIPLERAA